MFGFVVCLSLFLVQIASEVIKLNENNFQSIVNGKTNVMVNFYAPWCQHCRVLAPHYHLLGETYEDGDDIIIAEVDGPANPKLTTEFLVSQYPNILFFPKTTNDPIPYPNEKSTEPMIQWINQKVGLERKFPLPKSSVVELDKSSFGPFISDRSSASIILFYSRGECPFGNCMGQIAKLEQLATIYKPDKKVKFGRLDGSVAPKIVVNYAAYNYPMYLYFHSSTDEGYSEENPPPEKLSDNPDLEELVKFVNEHSGLHRTVEGNLEETAGTIKEINELIQKVSEIDANFLIEMKEILRKLHEHYVKEDVYYSEEMQLSEKFYLSYGEKILERGWQFLHYEIERLEKFLEPSKSISRKKKTEMMLKMNICRAYLKNYRHSYETLG